MGVLLASHPASSELARSLFHIKELLLVAFFVSIGLTGLPDLPSIGIPPLMLLLLPFKAAWYVLLLSRLRLRYRSALLAGLSLMNYSEFGLIVVSVGVSAGLLQQVWNQLRRSDSVRIAVLAIPRHGANVTALECLRESGFSGKVAAVARYDDEVQWAKDHGVGIAVNVYAGAGLELADQVADDSAPRSGKSTLRDSDSPEPGGGC